MRPTTRSPQKLLLIGGVVVLAGLLAWAIFGGPHLDRTRVYRVGYANDAPLHFQTADGQPAGLAVELVREAARRSGIEVKWVHGTGFNQQTMDMWVLQTIRSVPPRSVYFTEPYLQAESGFLVVDNSPVRSLADLTHARISSNGSRANREAIDRLLPGCQQLPAPSTREALAKVLTGEADAALVDQYAIFSLLLSGGERVPLRILHERSPRRNMAIAARFELREVADELWRSIRTMAEDGSVKPIVSRWAFFPNLTADVIGELAREERRILWLRIGLGGLAAFLILTTGLAILSRRRAERLRRAETLLRKVADRVPGVVYQFRMRPDGTCSFPYASETMRQIFRLAPEDLKESSAAMFDLVHPDDRASVDATTQTSARELTMWNHEYRLKFPDGTVKWVQGHAQPQREADGGTLWHGFIMDVTERKAGEAALQTFQHNLQETQKLESLGVLAGGIAHDFNNLLTGILGNASLASLTLPAGAPAQSHLDSIRRGSLRAADLCKQMLAYSGQGRFVVKLLSLNTLIEETTQLLRLSISKQAALRFELAPDLPAIEADATQIQQVIMNLVINASEAIGPANGVIGIRTGLARVDHDYLAGTVLGPELATGTYVFLEVSDNGVGMSAELQAKIFDPFFTTKFAGRGLGLAAVLGIVRGHKGALKVYSEPGKGTTFKLLFRGAEGRPEEEKRPVSTAWKGDGCILVVDDEEIVRHTATLMLQKVGFEVVLASDGEEAVSVFRASPDKFKLVLMDLTMPRMGGQAAFSELRRIRSEVRVVLMSGFNETEAVSSFSGKGLAGFLSKPFDFDALSETLRRAAGPARI